MGKVNNLVGKKFGMLTVINITNKRGKQGNVIFVCRCDCGNIIEINSKTIGKGTNSCGCMHLKSALISIRKANKAMSKYSIENTNIALLNQKKRKNNTSGYKGISFNNEKNKWAVRININKKSIHIGYFDKLEDAIFARKKAEEIYFKPVIDKFNELNNN